MYKLFNITEIAVIMESLPKRYRSEVWLKNFAGHQHPNVYRYLKF
jgi:hypothetical protein